MSNPLLEANTLPRFDEIQAEHMVPAIEAIITSCREGIAAILESGRYTYNDLVKAREELEDKLHQAYSPIGHLNSVMNSPEIREANETCRSLLTEYATEMGQHQGLFEAYSTLEASDEFASLDTAEKKVVTNALRDFRLSGIDLPEAEQKRFAELAQQLSTQQNTFNNNVLDATMAWTKRIHDVSELPGVPDNALAQMAQAAKAKDLEGYLLTLEMPCYLAIVTYCENRELREEIARAFTTRASHLGPQAGEYDNSDIMQEILAARLEQARLLGFDTYADMSIARKMARTTDEVLNFLNDLADKSVEQARKELAEIQVYATEEGGPEVLMPWDIGFYAEKFKKAAFDISDEDLRPYFAAPAVLQGMFEVVRRLFDIEVKANDNMKSWHDDVFTYDICRDGQPIARFYLDLYARENKRGGAWMDDCRIRRTDTEGNLHLPVAYLTCNFSGPVGDDPALLSHREVVTLFHEFGHGLQHMLTQISAADVSGINGVAWDAVELPSQFMENFCWEAESLSFISSHYQTGEPLPAEMLDNLLKARHFQAAMMMVRQLEFGLFDFRLHVENDGSEGQIQTVLDEVRDKVAVVKPAGENAFQHAFSHIFGGGYAAGYYSYKWAEVLSANAFSKFLEDGLFNRQTGEKFLSTILEKGGSVDAMDLFIEFRGREPEVEALLKQEGIAA